MLSNLLLLQMLTLAAFSLTSSPSWVGNASLKTGMSQLTMTNSLTYYNVSTTFPAAFPSAPACIPGLGGLQVRPTNLDYMSIHLSFTATASSVLQMLYLYNGTTINAISLAYLCYNPSVMTTFSFQAGFYSSNFTTSGSTMATGSGYRVQTKITTTWYSGGMNLSRPITMIPILNTVLLRRTTTTTNWQFKAEAAVINSTAFSITYTTDGSCSVEYAATNRITYQPTAISANQQVYHDSVSFTASNNVSNSFNLPNPCTLFVGLNTFNFSSTSVPNFKFDTTSFVLTSPNYVYLNISVFNFRNRSCDISTPYFVEAQVLCYDACPTGYYPQTTYYYCIPCNPICMTCTSNTNTTCTSCSAATNRELSGTTCPCAYGFYESGVTICSACSPLCGSCTGFPNNCTACPANSFRTLSANSCPCNFGYVNVNSTVCDPCNGTMAGCLACTSTTRCTSCDLTKYMSLNSTTFRCDCSAGNYRTMTSNACLCMTGYTDAGVATCATCISQIPGCLTCDSITVCTSCSSTSFWQLNGTSCSCVTGYTQSGTNCVTCASFIPGCLECSSSMSCSRCNAALNRVLSSITCVCDSGYAVSSNLCVSCGTLILGCSLCSSAAVCTSCNAGLHMQLSGSSCVCMAGYTLVSGVCNPCNATLEGCTTCFSHSVCSACDSSLNMVLSGSACVCAEGYIKSSGSCTACSSFVPMCSNCSSTSVCTSCDSSHHAVLNNGACECDNGYALSSGTCAACGTLVLGCMTCSSSTVCTNCDELKFMVLSGSSCVCKSGYVLVSGVCNPCNSTLAGCTSCSSPSICETCDSGLNTVLSGSSCICADGYANSSGSCEVCSTFIPMCSNCSSTSVCTNCDSSLHAVLNSGACDCAGGYTMSSGSCVTCGSLLTGCSNCSSTTDCTACDQLQFMTLSGTSCICLPGYLLQSGVCNTCNSTIVGCTSCSSSSICDACDSTLNMVLSGSSCVCADGYIDSSGSCTQCSTFIPMCTNCSSTSICTVCDSSLNAVLSGGSCDCSNGYALVGSQCETCSSLMLGCMTCSSLTICTNCDELKFMILSGSSCVCKAGYVLVSGVCNPCNSTLAGCTSCSDPSTCDACDSNLNTILSGSNCVCTDGFANSSGSCEKCSSLILMCSNCSSASVCTVCDSSLHAVLNNGACECDSGYAMSNGACETCPSVITRCLLCSSASVCTSCETGSTVQSGICPLCSVLINGCANCSSSTVCTACDPAKSMHLSGGICTCDSGYALDHNICASCSSLIAHCQLCSSSTHCTSCVAGYYVNSALTCSVCSTQMAGCLVCSSGSVCTTCDTANHFTLSNSNICQCQIGYFFNSNTSTCGDCSAEILNCLQCTSTTSCSQCVSPLRFTGGKCTCSQANQYYDQSQLACVNCNASCSTCSSSSVCLTCDSSLFRVLSGSFCVCKPNYQENSSGVCVSLSSCVTGFVYNGRVCVEICGDGILFELPCDDGNIESGDGCSSTCTIETNFTCRGGSATAPTKCSYNKPLEIKLSSTKKDLYANAINFTLKVAPGLKVLQSFNFSAILTSNLPTSSITVTYVSDNKSPVKSSASSEPLVGASSATGTLIVRAIYVKSIQYLSASLQFLPPTSQDNTFDMKVSSSDFVVDPDNAPAYFYSDGTYSAASTMKVLLNVCLIVALVNLIVGVGFWKLVGVEAVHVIQVLFLACSLIVSLPPSMVPATDMWPSLGYNKLFTDFPNLYNFDSPDMPQTLAQMGMGARFVQNCNYMLAAQLAVLVIGAMVFLLSRTIDRCSEGMLVVAKFVLNEVFMVVVLFNCMNVGFSLGLHALYWNRPQAQSLASQALNLAPAAGFFLVAFVHYYIMHTREHYFANNSKLLKEDKLSQSHPIVMFVARTLLGVTLAGLREYRYGFIAPLSVQLIYLIYVAAKRPYKMVVASVRGIVSESVILITLGVAALYGSDAFSPTVSESSWGQYTNAPAWVLYSLIAATLLFHLGCQLFAMNKFMLKKNSNEVNADDISKNEEGSSSKRLDRSTDLPIKHSTNVRREMVEASMNELIEERRQNDFPRRRIIKRTRPAKVDMVVGMKQSFAPEADFEV